MSLCWFLDTLNLINHEIYLTNIYNKNAPKWQWWCPISRFESPPQNLSKNEFTNMVEKLPQNMLNFQYHTYEHILLRKKLRETKMWSAR